jgi:methylenetetrahydrofolate--tRNA-(uracil-5-)-methyltransferase
VVRGLDPAVPPPTTMMGGLMRYLRESDPKHFAPMNSNFGLLDPLDVVVKKKELKREKLVERARADFAAWMETNRITGGVEAAAAR